MADIPIHTLPDLESAHSVHNGVDGGVVSETHEFEATGAYHGDEHHAGPHLLDTQAHEVWGFDVFDFHIAITNTIITTWVFMALLLFVSVILYRSVHLRRGRLFTAGVIVVRLIDTMLTQLIGNQQFARRSLFFLGSILIYIMAANIFSLFLDWILTFSPPVLHNYLRPIHSDLTTTFSLSVVVILVSHFVMFAHRGVLGYFKHFLFHFDGDNIVEKIVNVPVGWIHAIGEAVRTLSLSLRLFGNIFGGATLIATLVWVTGQIEFGALPIGQLLVIPFWFFELMVAVVQAAVFVLLSSLYFKDAIHH